MDHRVNATNLDELPCQLFFWIVFVLSHSDLSVRQSTIRRNAFCPRVEPLSYIRLNQFSLASTYFENYVILATKKGVVNQFPQYFFKEPLY